MSTDQPATGVTFDERDPATWLDRITPAGYVWRPVSEEEEQFYAPDGRNLTEAYYQRFDN